MKYIMTALIVLVSAGYSQAETRTVLFDQGHGQLFTINEQGALDLTRLARRPVKIFPVIYWLMSMY